MLYPSNTYNFFLANYISIKLGPRLNDWTELNVAGEIQASKKETKILEAWRICHLFRLLVHRVWGWPRQVWVEGVWQASRAPPVVPHLWEVFWSVCAAPSHVASGMASWSGGSSRSHVWLLTLVLKYMDPMLLSLGCLTLKEAGRCVMGALEQPHGEIYVVWNGGFCHQL